MSFSTICHGSAVEYGSYEQQCVVHWSTTRPATPKPLVRCCAAPEIVRSPKLQTSLNYLKFQSAIKLGMLHQRGRVFRFSTLLQRVAKLLITLLLPPYSVPSPPTNLTSPLSFVPEGSLRRSVPAAWPMECNEPGYRIIVPFCTAPFLTTDACEIFVGSQ